MQRAIVGAAADAASLRRVVAVLVGRGGDGGEGGEKMMMMMPYVRWHLYWTGHARHALSPRPAQHQNMVTPLAVLAQLLFSPPRPL